MKRTRFEASTVADGEEKNCSSSGGGCARGWRCPAMAAACAAVSGLKKNGWRGGGAAVGCGNGGRKN